MMFVVAAALLLQSFAGLGGLVCIGDDHLGMGSESVHACCEHQEEAPASTPSASALHDDGCGCVDIGVSDDPMQAKRLGALFDVDSSARWVAWLIPHAPRAITLTPRTDRSDQRSQRGVVLLI